MTYLLERNGFGYVIHHPVRERLVELADRYPGTWITADGMRLMFPVLPTESDPPSPSIPQLGPLLRARP